VLGASVRHARDLITDVAYLFEAGHDHGNGRYAGELLAKLDRIEEARREFTRATALTSNERERALFGRRTAGK
jgi:predicted RNA polymerase sigma factor